MTSAERIEYRQENWRGKTFGNVSNMHTRVSDEVVTMELLWKPIVTKEMEEHYWRRDAYQSVRKVLDCLQPLHLYEQYLR